MRLYFEVTDQRPPDVSIRRWRTFNRDAMAEVGNLYDDVFKMRHFEPGASSRYGYRPRTPAHIARKAKAVARNSFTVSPDANRDLIFSGALRKAVKMKHLPRAFPTRVTVNMPTPSYAQMKPRRPNMPNLGDEIVRVTNDEMGEMERAYKASLEHDLNSYREPKTTRIG